MLALANAAGCSCEGKGPEVTAYFDPPVVIAGRTTTVALVGTHTRFTEREDLVTFDDPALRPVFVRVDSPVQARIPLDVGSDAQEGVHVAEIRTAGHVVKASLEVRTIVPEPSLEIEPGSAPPGSDMHVTLTGYDTCFERGATTLRFFPEGEGITVHSLEVEDAEHASAAISVALNAIPGEHSAVVEAPCGPVSATFTVIDQLGPRIRITPDSAYAGQEVVVTVTGTETAFDDSTQAFVGASISVDSVVVESPTALVATLTIGPRAVTGARTFQTETGTDNESATFTVLREPGAPFVRIVPNHVVRGERALLWVEGIRTVFAGNLPASLVDGPAGVEVLGSWVVGPNDAVLDVQAPADGGEGEVTVELGEGADALPGSFVVVAPTDGTVEVSPATVAAGDSGITLTLTGDGTAFRADRTEVVAPAAAGVSVGPIVVRSATEIEVPLDVSPTAPDGSFDLEVRGGRQPIRVRLEVESAALGIQPPAIRAGPAETTLVLDPGEAVADPAVRVLVPEVTLAAPVAGDPVSAAATIGPGAPPGWAAVELAGADFVRAAPLAVLARPSPACEPSRSAVTAGTSALVGLATEDTTFIDPFTSVDGPFVSFFQLFGSDLIVQIDVPSDTPQGPTGIVVSTRGEIAACVLDVVAPAVLPSARLAAGQMPIVPGAEETVHVDGTATTFEVGGTVAVVPGGLGVVAGDMTVKSATRLDLVVSAEGGATVGAIPLTILTNDLEVVRLPIFVGPEGTPTAALDPLVVRTGVTTTLQAVVSGLDLAGTLDVRVDAEGVLPSDVRVVSVAESRLEIDLDVAASALEGLDWLTIGDGVASASALFYVRRGTPRVASDPVRVVRGAGPVTASWDVSLGSLSPGDTIARVAPLGTRVRVLDATPAAPEQVSLTLEGLAPGGDVPARLLLVTDDEVVVGDLDVRADGAAALQAPGSAAGDTVPGSPALFRIDDPGATAWLDVALDNDTVGAEILSADGSAVLGGLSPRVSSWYASGGAPFVRISATDGEGGAFALATTNLGEGASAELEPNADPLTAEPLGDPAIRAALLEIEVGGADVDVLRVDASAAAALEVSAPGDGWSIPRVSLQPIDAAGAAIGDATVGQSPVVVLAEGSTSYFAVSTVAGSHGPCLVNARSEVEVSEVAPGDAGFVELRGVPGSSLDGWSLELVDTGGGVLGTIDLSGAVVGASRVLVVGAVAGDLVDSTVSDLVASAGSVRVLHAGRTLDQVTWGALGGAGSAPAPPDGGSIGRPWGIDRDDDAADFAARSTPSPGAEN